MNYLHNMVLYHTVTPLHVGVGRDVGVVDLPVFRERTSGFPAMPGSGIRGSVRAAFPDTAALDGGLLTKLGKAEITALKAKLFGREAGGRGPEEPDGEAEDEPDAGSVAVHDAKILLFPVRSDRRVFVWITCPAAIGRLGTEAEVFLGGAASGGPWHVNLQGQYGAGSFDEQFLSVDGSGDGLGSGPVHVEEFELSPAPEGEATAADREALRELTDRLGSELGIASLSENTVLVSDRTFHHFVNHATLVLQHNRLDAQKTVAQGQLFSLEAVPPETIFFGWMGTTEGRWLESTDGDGEGKAQEIRLGREDISGLLQKGLRGNGDSLPAFHFGGQESTGLGVTRVAWIGGQGGS